MYGAVAYHDDGINILQNEDLTVLLYNLCKVIHDGMDGYMIGTVTNPDTFKTDVERIVNGDYSEYEEMADAIMELLLGIEFENAPPFYSV